MCVGGSGLNLMMHVRFMVLPLSTYRSGPPRIVAVGTAKELANGHRQLQLWEIEANCVAQLKRQITDKISQAT